MNDIPEEALRTIEETFGTRFVWLYSLYSDFSKTSPDPLIPISLA